MAKIKKAIYSDPYVHILWDDGTKTSSKCDEYDEYDELTGFLMCVLKKTMRHKDMRSMLNTFVYGNDKKYVKRDKKYTKPVRIDVPVDVIRPDRKPEKKMASGFLDDEGISEILRFLLF